MKNLIIPFIVKKQKNQLTRLIYNENQYSNNFDVLRNEILKIYNSIHGIEVSYSKVLSDVIQANFSENHCLINVCDKINIVFINYNKIPQFHSVESIANSILKDNSKN